MMATLAFNELTYCLTLPFFLIFIDSIYFKNKTRALGNVSSKFSLVIIWRKRSFASLLITRFLLTEKCELFGMMYFYLNLNVFVILCFLAETLFRNVGYRWFSTKTKFWKVTTCQCKLGVCYWQCSIKKVTVLYTCLFTSCQYHQKICVIWCLNLVL